MLQAPWTQNIPTLGKQLTRSAPLSTVGTGGRCPPSKLRSLTVTVRSSIQYCMRVHKIAGACGVFRGGLSHSFGTPLADSLKVITDGIGQLAILYWHPPHEDVGSGELSLRPERTAGVNTTCHSCSF